MIAEDMRAWLPAQHAAWLVLAAVRRLDLSRFHAVYRADGKGQAPYDPGMMLAVIYYCGLKDVMSTRKLRDACTDDVGARLIAGGARPSNKAFAEFKRRHRDAIRELFAPVAGVLKAEGVISDDDEVAAIDGSPVSTAAALSSNMTAAQLDAEIAAAEQALAAELEAWAAASAADGAQDALWQDEDGSGAVPPGSGRKLAAAHRRLARLEAARQRAGERAAVPDAKAQARLAKARDKAAAAGARVAALEADADAKLARYQARTGAGKKWAGKKPVPADVSARVANARRNAATARQRLAAAEAACAGAAAVRVSATDPDSRILPAKNGGWVQGFNFQASAGRSQVLLATGIHDNPADVGALVAMIHATDATCDDAGIARKPVKTADTGYACEASFTALAGRTDLILVAVSKEAVAAGRRDPAGTRPVPGPWQDMAARLGEPENKQLYKKRGQYVEPFFAQTFQRNGRRIPYRGTDAVSAELSLRGQIHNLAKLFTHWNRIGRLIPAPA
ncbi:MAG: transposase [Streptosporangiaceae bacterium]|nr:transposase [Streptosporangiaceae bacterium]